MIELIKYFLKLHYSNKRNIELKIRSKKNHHDSKSDVIIDLKVKKG